MKPFRKPLLVLGGAVCVAALVYGILWSRRSSEAEGLAARLSWESVGGNCIGTVLVVYPDGPEAKRLVKIGAPSAKALLSALEDPTRAVAAHLILTAIFLPERYHLSTEDHAEFLDELSPVGTRLPTGSTFEINGLQWDSWYKTNSCSVDVAKMTSNARRWREILGNPDAPAAWFAARIWLRQAVRSVPPKPQPPLEFFWQSAGTERCSEKGELLCLGGQAPDGPCCSALSFPYDAPTFPVAPCWSRLFLVAREGGNPEPSGCGRGGKAFVDEGGEPDLHLLAVGG